MYPPIFCFEGRISVWRLFNTPFLFLFSFCFRKVSWSGRALGQIGLAGWVRREEWLDYDIYDEMSWHGRDISAP